VPAWRRRRDVAYGRVTVTASGAATAATAPVPAARTARLYVPAGVAELVLTVTVLALTPFASDAGFAVAGGGGAAPPSPRV
jgi:hypothetical protein